MIKILSGNEVDKKVRKIISGSLLFDRKKEEAVRSIIDEVKELGDKALIKYTKKFDGVTIKADEIKVTSKEINEAYKIISDEYLRTLKTAIRNITAHCSSGRAWLSPSG